MKFYRCEPSGQILTTLGDSPLTVSGQEITELIPGTVDAAVEKHIPVFTREGSTVTVKVGSVSHPMLAAHFIQWVALETNMGCQIKYLKPETEPAATFLLAPGEEPVSVYEYCNLHGLWKA